MPFGSSRASGTRRCREGRRPDEEPVGAPPDDSPAGGCPRAWRNGVLALDLRPDEVQAIWLSLRVATWAVIWSLPFGVLAALLLARGRFRGKALLDTVLHLPLILPPVVTGYALLLLFGRRGVLGAFLAETFGVVFAFR